MFKDNKTREDMIVYVEYRRIVEIISTDEYSDMYDKIGAINAQISKINDIMGM